MVFIFMFGYSSVLSDYLSLLSTNPGLFQYKILHAENKNFSCKMGNLSFLLLKFVKSSEFLDMCGNTNPITVLFSFFARYFTIQLATIKHIMVTRR